jgi:uncharacterized protein (UPF0332 family)
MIELDRVYLEKAEENLACAQSELINGRYNSSASRAYYCCFQAAIFALARAGIRSTGAQRAWSHEFVQAQFNGVLVNRRRLYSADLRGTLNQNYILRLLADYSTDHVTEVRADRAVGRAERFLEAIRPQGGQRP